MRSIQSYIIGALFVAAGALHFRNPRMYEAIELPYIPAHREIVYVSGFFEMLGGLGLLLPRTRIAASYGLIALLLAVFPANVYMATDAERFAEVAPALVFFARLPLQFALIWWIYKACVKRPE